MQGRFKTAAIMAAVVMQALPTLAAPYKPAQWIVVGGNGSDTMSIDYNRVKRNGTTYGMPAAIAGSSGSQTFWFWVGCESRSHMTIDKYGIPSTWEIAAPGSAAESVMDLVCKTRSPAATAIAPGRTLAPMDDIPPVAATNLEPLVRSITDADLDATVPSRLPHPTPLPRIPGPDLRPAELRHLGAVPARLPGGEPLRELCQSGSGVSISQTDCDRLQQGSPPIRFNARTR